MGLINKALRRVLDEQERDRELREDRYREHRMKHDYYRSPKCPRTGGGTAEKCASCTLAPMCKTGSRSW